MGVYLTFIRFDKLYFLYLQILHYHELLVIICLSSLASCATLSQHHHILFSDYVFYFPWEEF